MARMILVVSMVLAFAPAAGAVDGVLEINQACVSVGCFSGDAPNWPVEIDGSAGRSYRLTSDLIVPNENTHGIVVAKLGSRVNNVSIDLNGFAIIGAACVGEWISECRPVSGLGNGVGSQGQRGTSVKNGSITGMGLHGVYLPEMESEATNLRVRWNRANGIEVGFGSTVSENIANANGGYGIKANQGVTVSGNTVYDNLLDGINAVGGSTVSGNTAYQNGGDGIAAGAGSLVSGNTVRSNDGFGLELGGSSTASYINNNITVNGSGGVHGGTNRGGNYCYNGGDISTSCP